MSFEAVRKAIAAEIAAITMPFPTGHEGGKEVGPLPVWGRWQINQGATDPMELNSRSVRGIGDLTLQVFIAEEGGTKHAGIAADLIGTALNRKQVRTGQTVITFDTAGIYDTATREGYLQKNISIPFKRETYPA